MSTFDIEISLSRHDHLIKSGESLFEFEIVSSKSMKNNQVFLAGFEENAEQYPGEIRLVSI